MEGNDNLPSENRTRRGAVILLVHRRRAEGAKTKSQLYQVRKGSSLLGAKRLRPAADLFLRVDRQRERNKNSAAGIYTNPMVRVARSVAVVCSQMVACARGNGIEVKGSRLRGSAARRIKRDGRDGTNGDKWHYE